MRYQGKKRNRGIKVAILLGAMIVLLISIPIVKDYYTERIYVGYVTKCYWRNARDVFDKSLVYATTEDGEMVFSLEYFIRHHIHNYIVPGHTYEFVVRGNEEIPEIIQYEEK